MRAPVVGDDDITFHVPDPHGRLEAVRLQQELERPRDGPAFARRNGGFELRFPRHPVLRMEYLLALRDRDGNETHALDPAVAQIAPGAFGDRTDLRLPGYREPDWITHEPTVTGRREPMTIASESLGRSFDAEIWTAPMAREDAPLLFVHDGPEYDRFARLGHLLDVLTTRRVVPPLRAVLIAPIDRNDLYGANEAYAEVLADEILPAVRGRGSLVIGLGASLGALALLHAHARRPGLFGALVLQSGSFFHHATDDHERWFPPYGRISTFVDAVLTGATRVAPVPVALQCGLGEENLACNRRLAAAIARQGVPGGLHTFADAHNWIAWRDALDQALPGVLRQVMV